GAGRRTAWAAAAPSTTPRRRPRPPVAPRPADAPAPAGAAPPRHRSRPPSGPRASRRARRAPCSGRGAYVWETALVLVIPAHAGIHGRQALGTWPVISG